MNGTPDSTQAQCREMLATEKTADYTGILIVVGVLQFLGLIGQIIALVVTIRQSRIATGAAVDSVRAAQRSAKAAEDAVETLPTVERAHIYPEMVSPGGIDRLLQEARVYYLDGLDSYDKPMPEAGNAFIKFTNFGKTPALLKEAFASVGIGPLGALRGLSIPQGVLGPSLSTGKIECVMDQGFTRNQATHVGVLTAHVCIEGHVVFADIWGVEHRTDFYFVWNQELRNFVLQSAETKRTDGKA